MFRPRVIFYIHGKTHYFVRSPCLVRSCELSIKKFHLTKIKLYSNVKNEKQRPTSNAVKVENVHLEELHQLKAKGLNEYENFIGKRCLYEENTKKYESESETTNDTELTENKSLHKDVSKLYPECHSAVANIYSILMKELGDQSLLRVKYKSCKINKGLFWECTYLVSWPTKKSFTAMRTSKKSASKEAALKCLCWLHEQGRLKGNKPIIYTKDEVEAKLYKPVPIHLDSDILKEVKELLQIYEEDVKDIIESPKVSNDLFTLRVSNVINEMSTSFTYCHKRNEILQERLSKKVNECSNLPILQYREEILHKLENNNILLIRGSTGCGKTTQVPQFIMDSYIKQGNATNCNILVSQPRRISAVSLAERIASERGEIVGDVVGYSIRLEKKCPQFPAGILLCTTGILCQIIQNNPNLKGYSHVILDEVHERTMEIDILFVLLKRALLNNPSLKLIVMSATINTELFSKYFNCDTIDVHGKTFPVKMHFLEDFEDILSTSEKQKNLDFHENYINKNTDTSITINFQQIVSLIKWILNTKSPGTILCFLPGWSEIKNVNTLLTMDSSIKQKLLILQLHSKLPIVNQHKIFDPAPSNTTKIILATDIAETGLTVPDVVYVIDTTIKNNPVWDNNKLCLQFQRISQANIQQRKGRAGRVRPGESYHFITEKEYDNLRSNPMPEILFSPLESIIINVKCHTDEKFATFCQHMIEPPSRSVIHNALKTLMQLDIIDEHEHLTPLGKRLAHISIHPSLGKALILSTIFKCSEPILSIATLNSVEQDIFANTLDNRSSKREVKELYHQTSDHLAMAKLYEEWIKNSNESYYKHELFCNEKNINPFRIRLLRKLRNVISNRLQIYGIQNHNYHNYDHNYDLEMLSSEDAYCDELIYGIILSSTNKLIKKNDLSYYKGIFKKKTQLTNENNQLVKIGVESVNYKRTSWPSSYVTYLHGMHQENIPYMLVYNSSIISPLTILLFGPGYIRNEPKNDSNNQKTIILILGGEKPLKFSCTSEEVETLTSFRKVIWSVVNYFLTIDNRRPSLINELNFMNEYRSELLRVLSKMLDTSAYKNKKVQ